MRNVACLAPAAFSLVAELICALSILAASFKSQQGVVGAEPHIIIRQHPGNQTESWQCLMVPKSIS